MKKTLVTGGAGFIGSNIVSLLLERKCEVTVLDNLSTGYRENLAGLRGVRLVEGDVRDGASLERLLADVDTVFHLAASVGNLKSIEHPALDAEINVLGTLAVLEAARKAKVQKVVYSSSSAIFGEVQYLPVDEKHPVEPDSPYGVTKLAAEKHALCYSRLYGMNVVCLRYFNVYGNNQRYDAYGNVIPIWTHRLLDGQPLFIYGDGEQTRDFINVKDVARANVLAAEAPGLSGAFNMGTGRSITINELASVFKKAAGRPLEFQYKPPRKGEVKHSQANVQSAGRAFAFAPTVAIESGVRDYIRWVQDELKVAA